MPLVSGTTLDGSPEIDGGMDDMAMAAAIARGDSGAIRVLVDRESARLARQCTRILGDPDAAQDVTQETFLVACRSMTSFRGEGTLGAWLSRIAVRLAWRQRRYDRRFEPLGDRETLPAGSAWSLPEGARGLDLIRSAVSTLPESQREVVMLHYFGELTLREIAAASGRPLGTIKSDLHRALTRLRVDLRREAAA